MNGPNLIISKKPLLISTSILIFLCIIFFDYTVFATSVRNGLIAVLFAVLIYIWGTGIPKFKVSIDTFLFILCTIVIVFFNNHESKKGNYSYIISVLFLLLVYISNRKFCKYWKRMFWRFMFIFGFIAASVTWLCYFFPDLYTTFILPNAWDTYRNSLIYCFNLGYQPGIAVHYSSNGMILAIFVGVLFSMYLNCNNKLKKSYFILLIIGIGALFLTAKRAHIVFSLAAMLIEYFYFNENAKHTRIFKLIGIIIAGLALFLIIGQFIPSIKSVVERFIESQEEGNLLNNRDTFYAYAILLFYRSPIFGNGWGSFKYSREATFGDYNNAHNVFMQLLAETGIVGTLLFISFFICAIYISIKNYKIVIKKIEPFQLIDYRCAGFAVYMQVFFLLYCFTGNPLYDRVMLAPTLLSLILCQSIVQPDGN